MEGINPWDISKVTMNVTRNKKNKSKNNNPERFVVSLNTLANMLDAHRSSVRRWLHEAGIKPIVLGRGRNGAIRYHWHDIECWLSSREKSN